MFSMLLLIDYKSSMSIDDCDDDGLFYYYIFFIMNGLI